MPATCNAANGSKKEVIRFKAKKYDGCTRPESKTFSADPDLTTFATLRELLIKAFDIKSDFVISYLVRGHKGTEDRYLPMLSEWDLNTAIYGASDPHVVLKIDLKPFEAPGLDEWDIIDDDDVSRVSSQSSSISIFNGGLTGGRRLFGDTTTTNESKRNRSRSRLWFFGRQNSDTVSLLPNSQATTTNGTKKSSSSKNPMTDAEFRSYLDAEGRLLHTNLFRLAVYKGGLEPSLRPVVWRHLLSIYPEGMTGEERILYTRRLAEKYSCMKETWQRRLRDGFINEELRLVANAVRKDVIRTDRTHSFFSGDEDSNKNLMELFNLLTTYALAHPEVSYCQGMSDLAAPLLVVMKDEAQAYICFCALMRRMKQNFSCDGWAMTRKFQHLSELLQYYDPTFYEYLREMHADDLLFAYRWLLLELKREFSFDDALKLMEVVWASLPATPPARGCELDLYDIDLTAYEDAFTYCPDNWSSPASGSTTLLSPIQLHQPLVSDDDPDPMDSNGGLTGDGGVPRSPSRPCRQFSSTNSHSCPANVDSGGLICTAVVVRSLMLNHKENTRLHALRHASYPPKYLALTLDREAENDAQINGPFPRITCWNDNGVVNGPSEASVPPEHKVEKTTIQLNGHANHQVKQQSEVPATTTNTFDANLRLARRQGQTRRSYALCPSTEMKVKDDEDDHEEKPSTTTTTAVNGEALPALVASDAGGELELTVKTDLGQRELTLLDIQEICLSHIPLESHSPSRTTNGSTKRSSVGIDRSREPSGGQAQQNLSVAPAPSTTSIFTGQGSNEKSRHASSSATSYIVTTLDSGYSDCNNTALTRSIDMASRASTTASTDPQNVTDVAEFICVDRDPRVLLPSPHEFGDGNPFMLFVCLTLLLQHRDHIMKNQMDFNEIAIYFDKLMRKHNVNKVLKRARVLFADYLRTGWFDNSTTITRADSNAASSSPAVAKCSEEDNDGKNGHKNTYWSLF